MCSSDCAPEGSTSSPDLQSVRAKAFSRALICGGTGFATIGCSRLAIIAFMAHFCALLALGWFVLAPGPRTVWTAISAVVAATMLWIAEFVFVRRVKPRCPTKTLLTRFWWLPALVLWSGVAVVLFSFFTGYRPLTVASNGMAPTCYAGERLFAARRVKSERLRAGTVIAFQNPRQSAWGKPGWIVVARILAVPGEEVCIQSGSYLVNGVARAPAGTSGPRPTALEIPAAPSTVSVPKGCYFVVQDKPEAFDSRTFWWVRRTDVISTDLYLLSGRGLAEKLE